MYAPTSSFQPWSSTFCGDRVAQLPPARARSRPCRSRQLDRPVDGQPAHDLRVHVVPRRAAAPPRCRGPARASAARPPRPSPPSAATSASATAARSATRRDQVGDRAEHVELDLAVGGVADPHRPGAGVPGQRVDHGLGAELVAVDRVQRVQPLRVPAGALDAPAAPSAAAPRPPRASRGRPAPGRSSRRRAASSTGSPSCGRRRSPRAATWSPRPGSRRSARGTARAGSARCAAPARGRPAGSCSERGPVPPARLGAPPAARRAGTGCGVELVGAEPQLEHDAAAGRRPGRPRRGRSSLPPSAMISHSTPGEYSAIGSAGAEHQQARRRAAAAGSAPARTPAAARTRSRARHVAGQHPDQRVARSRCPARRLVEPVGDGQARPAGLHGHRAAAGSAGRAAGRRAPGATVKCPAGGAAEQVGEERRASPAAGGTAR